MRYLITDEFFVSFRNTLVRSDFRSDESFPEFKTGSGNQKKWACENEGRFLSSNFKICLTLYVLYSTHKEILFGNLRL